MTSEVPDKPMPVAGLETASSALQRGEYKECIALCANGISNAQAEGNETEVWWFRCLRAQGLGMQGLFGEALSALGTEEVRHHLDANVRVQVMAQRAFYLARLGNYLQAKNVLEQAASVAKAESNEKLLAEVQLNRMTLFFYLAEYESMEECAEAALAVAQEESLHSIEAGACSGLGKSSMVRRRFREAIPWYERARMLFAAEGLPVDAMRMGSDLGCCYLGLGELDKAMELFTEALRFSEATGARACMHHDRANIGCVYLQRCEYGTALSHFQKALEIASELGDQISMGKWLRNLSLTYKGMGDPMQAIACELEAESVNRRVAQARAAAR